MGFFQAAKLEISQPCLMSSPPKLAPPAML